MTDTESAAIAEASVYHMYWQKEKDALDYAVEVLRAMEPTNPGLTKVLENIHKKRHLPPRRKRPKQDRHKKD